MMEAISHPTLKEGLFLSRHKSMQTCSSRDTVCVGHVERECQRHVCLVGAGEADSPVLFSERAGDDLLAWPDCPSH